MPEEKRTRTRVDLMFGAVLSCDGRDVPVRINNLSLRGLSCNPDPRLVVDAECTVRIALSGSVTIRVQGRVVRATQQDAAVEFVEMDPESFTHLRNLIRLHSEDPDRIDDELIARIGADQA